MKSRVLTPSTVLDRKYLSRCAIEKLGGVLAGAVDRGPLGEHVVYAITARVFAAERTAAGISGAERDAAAGG